VHRHGRRASVGPGATPGPGPPLRAVPSRKDVSRAPPTGPGRPLPLLAGLTALLACAAVPLGDAPPAAAASPARAALHTTSPSLGHDRIGVRRGDTWFLRDALDAGPSRGYREDVAGWVPLAGDFDGDGSGSLGLFSGGTFRLRDREGGPVRLVRFGGPGDQPVAGDWDGDGVDTVGVFRAGRWYLRASNSSGRRREPRLRPRPSRRRPGRR
jgi:hypothetical protein